MDNENGTEDLRPEPEEEEESRWCGHLSYILENPDSLDATDNASDGLEQDAGSNNSRGIKDEKSGYSAWRKWTFSITFQTTHL